MKIKTLIISSLLIAGILTGCNGQSATATIETETTTEIESTTESESTTSEIALENEKGMTSFSFAQGKTEEAIEETEPAPADIEEATIVDEAYEQPEEDGASTYTITDMDKIMYATKNCNVRKGPDADTFERIGALNQNDEVHVTGKVNEVNWYRISLADGSEAYVSAPLLSDTKQEAPATPTPTPTPAPSTGNGNTTQQPADNTPSSDVGGFVNPATGEPLKPGESFITPDGEEIHGPTDWSKYGF